MNKQIPVGQNSGRKQDLNNQNTPQLLTEQKNKKKESSFDKQFHQPPVAHKGNEKPLMPKDKSDTKGSLFIMKNWRSVSQKVVTFLAAYYVVFAAIGYGVAYFGKNITQNPIIFALAFPIAAPIAVLRLAKNLSVSLLNNYIIPFISKIPNFILNRAKEFYSEILAPAFRVYRFMAEMVGRFFKQVFVSMANLIVGFNAYILKPSLKFLKYLGTEGIPYVLRKVSHAMYVVFEAITDYVVDPIIATGRFLIKKAFTGLKFYAQVIWENTVWACKTFVEIVKWNANLINTYLIQPLRQLVVFFGEKLLEGIDVTARAILNYVLKPVWSKLTYFIKEIVPFVAQKFVQAVQVCAMWIYNNILSPIFFHYIPLAYSAIYSGISSTWQAIRGTSGRIFTPIYKSISEPLVSAYEATYSVVTEDIPVMMNNVYNEVYNLAAVELPNAVSAIMDGINTTYNNIIEIFSPNK